MADEVTAKNMYLINAPAGSGKTTTIKRMIRDKVDSDISAKILCITYTNRATDELLKEYFPECVEISTIHSFINKFMGNYFGHKAILDLYFKIYNDAIVKRINNPDNDDRINESNNRYKEKYGSLDIDTIKSNVKRLYYNELDFNSLFSGGICHDDLLTFANTAIERYPVLRKRINEKYDYVFIDEYQDTSSAVLDIFYYALKDTNVELYLFGDKMQQIYKNYDGEFKEKLADFDLSNKLKTNYRSTKPIIDILNRIYNDEEYDQEPSEENKETENPTMPKIVISDDVEKDIKEHEALYSDSLILYIANRMRFQKIGAEGLYNAVNRMDRYGFGSKHSVVDVLTQNSNDNPDGLFGLLFYLYELKECFDNKKYGSVVQLIKQHKMFDNEALSLNYHSDKTVLHSKLKVCVDLLNSEKKIKEILVSLCADSILIKEKLDVYLTNEDYNLVMEVRVTEFISLLKYLNNPHVSTQHGVKGESHNTVIFVAEDSSTPMVRMYDFLKLWTEVDIKLTEFEALYFPVYRALEKILEEIGLKRISDFNSTLYGDNKERLERALGELSRENSENPYYLHIYQPKIDYYYERPGMGRMKECININLLYGIYVAYKLFYVGCSRARKNLTILISKSKVLEFESKLTEKLQSIGFIVDDKMDNEGNSDE